MEPLLVYIGQYMFHIFGLMAICGAIGMVFSRNAIHSVVCFLLAMLAISGCYVCLSAEFLAVAQLLIYAGGIVVLFLFVVMLVEVTKYKENAIFRPKTPYMVATVLVGVLVIINMLGKVLFVPTVGNTSELSPTIGHGLNVTTQNSQIISRGVFSGYILPFEILSVILLVALVGAVVLAKKDVV